MRGIIISNVNESIADLKKMIVLRMVFAYPQSSNQYKRFLKDCRYEPKRTSSATSAKVILIDSNQAAKRVIRPSFSKNLFVIIFQNQKHHNVFLR